MTGAPTTASFTVVWPTNIPTVLDAQGFHSADIVGTFNIMPSQFYADIIAAKVNPGSFQGLPVTNVQVVDAKWVNSGGMAALQFGLVVTSDPVTVGDVASVLVGSAGIIMAAILGAWAALGTFADPSIAALLAVLAVISLVIGAVAFAAPSISAGFSAVSSGFNIVVYGVGAAIIIGAAVFVYDYLKDTEFRKETYRAVGGAAGRAAGEGIRLGGGGAGRVASASLGAGRAAFRGLARGLARPKRGSRSTKRHSKS